MVFRPFNPSFLNVSSERDSICIFLKIILNSFDKYFSVTPSLQCGVIISSSCKNKFNFSPMQYKWTLFKSSTVTPQRMKFSINDFFSKCDQIRRKRQIWSDLLKKSLMENFIFCVVCPRCFRGPVAEFYRTAIFQNVSALLMKRQLFPGIFCMVIFFQIIYCRKIP